MAKVHELEDADIYFILAHFSKEELDVIERYNNLVGEAINGKN